MANFSEILQITICSALLFQPSYAQVVEEVVIEAEYIPDEKLATAEVADLLDAETIGIAGDSDLGGALKRVPGLSLVGGKFIYVRGLGERYSATYFNGTPMPSPEPLQRAVPLDLFDTSITKNVLVQKTHSADFGIEFSGGLVDIRSAAVPDEGFFKFKVSTAYNDISTGKSSLTSDGGSRDFLGFDDGSRELPSLIANRIGDYPNIFGSEIQAPVDPTTSFQNRARLSFTNTDFEPSESSNPYDYGLSLSGGQRYQIHERVDIGFISVASLNNRWRNRETQDTSYIPGQARLNLDVIRSNIDRIRRQAIFDQAVDLSTGSDLDLVALGFRELFNQQRSQRTIRSNLLFSVGSVIDQQHFINLTSLIARITRDTAIREQATVVQTDTRFTRGSRIDFAENEINLKQLNGEHILDSANIQWRYALIDSLRDQLDTRDVVRESRNGSPFILQTVGTEPTRRFSFLDDKTTDTGFDIELPFARDQGIFSEFKMKFGASVTEQARDFQGLEFQYDVRGLGGNQPVLGLPIQQLIDPSQCVLGADPVSPATVDTECFLATNFSGIPGSSATTNLEAITITDGSASNLDDFYSGLSRLEAQYIVLDMQILELLRLNVGVRRERTTLEVSDRDGELLFRLNADGEKDAAQIHRKDQLSSFSLTWDVYRNMIIRAAYSETVNRPILREIAPVRLFNAADGRFYVGNVALRVAEIENYDLRYELYFGENDYFSISAFKKRIRNPIEVFERETAEEILAFGWENSELAINEGFEIELRKYITPEFYVTANATIIDSVVTDTGDVERSLAASGVTQRSLTGVSKELYNAQFIYDNDSIQASLSYNKYSRRIDSISVSPVASLTGGLYSVVVEEPFTSLDVNVKLKLQLRDGKLAFGFKASNLLDESIERVVDNVGNLPAENYDVGQTYSLSIEWQQ